MFLAACGDRFAIGGGDLHHRLLDALGENRMHLDADTTAGEKSGDRGKGIEAFLQVRRSDRGFVIENTGDLLDVAGKPCGETCAHRGEVAFDIIHEAVLLAHLEIEFFDLVLDAAQGFLPACECLFQCAVAGAGHEQVGGEAIAQCGDAIFDAECRQCAAEFLARGLGKHVDAIRLVVARVFIRGHRNEHDFFQFALLPCGEVVP